ncbi:hypothetical protein GCM10011608_10690 [Micromonospora sonchi]|uniref:Uncharacterized protein n=1 Tax=Micromonospora sonchi TaxID=1763543 RepID=A0A917WSI3_9ACTN|nr:hypothetical protein [Micromonospora sonchi]GGM27741.1 hypothetical protein GCM10011608_10690 [Micromonospora sonchi]
MADFNLTLVWADKPNTANGHTVIACTENQGTIWYYSGAAGRGWTMIAVTLHAREADGWQRFRVDRRAAATDVAAWLDAIAGEATS